MKSVFTFLYSHVDNLTRKRLWCYAAISFLSPVINLFGISAILPILNNVMNNTAGTKDIVLAFGMSFLMIISGVFDLYSNKLSGTLTHEGAHKLSIKIYDLTLKENLLLHYEKDAMQALALIRTDTLKCLELLKATVTSIVSAIILLVFLIFLVVIDGWIGIIIGISVIAQMLVMYLKNRKKMRDFGEKIREADIQTNGQVTTAFGAYKEIKTEGNPTSFVDKYIAKSIESAKLKIEYSNQNAFIGVVMKNCVYMFMFLALAFIMLSQLNLAVYISKIVATVMVVIKVLPLGNKVVNSVNAIKSSEKSYECVKKALLDHSKVIESENKKKQLRQKTISFNKGMFVKDLCFAYPNGKVIFDHASMDIPVGSSVAIIGQSGAGKTTLLDILLGLIKPQSGSIYFDDYESVSMSDEQGPCVANIGDIVSYIPQVVFMNGSTVKENVAFFDRNEVVSDSKVKECLEHACILEDVMGMPDGINTLIGPKGIAISGGQRQRIALARALYKEFELLIMDEATAALDSDTEKAVMESIEKVKKNKTLIMVTHHDYVSSVCDVVYRVKEGKIVREK